MCLGIFSVSKATSATIPHLIFALGCAVLSLIWLPSAVAAKPQVEVQLLGSGGPELTDQRSSTSYLIRLDGDAKLLVDTGPGSSLRFEQSGADFNDVDAILYTHFHVDHSGDLPAFIKGSYFTGRERDLTIYGPTGNSLMPSATAFVDGLFGKQGIYGYLGEFYQPELKGAYKIHPVDVAAGEDKPFAATLSKSDKIRAVPVHHGPIPALAWRIDIGACSITVSGDTNNRNEKLQSFAKNSDLFIAHHAIPEQAGQVARNLHMPPSMIGKIAGAAGVKKLLLSHRMTRTEGLESQTTHEIRRYYQGPIEFAKDRAVYQPCS